MAYAVAAAIYIAMGFYRWRLDRQSVDPQGFAGVISWTLVLGTAANIVIWVAFFH